MFKRIALWLVVATAVLSLLVVVAGLLAEKFINNPDVKRKIQQKAAAAGGITLDYQNIGIGYYPLPVIELHGLTFTLPENVHGQADSVRILPDIAGLFSGSLPAGRIELVRPDISVTLQDPKAITPSTDRTAQEKNTSGPLAGLSIAGSKLVISDGRFTVQKGDGKLEGDGVALTLKLSLGREQTATVDLATTLTRLTIEKGSQRQSLEKIGLTGSGTIQGSIMAIRLEELTMARPALGLSGSVDQTDKGVRLDIVGQNIDVDATRAAALGIAGKTTPIPEIFTYLTGGTVLQIHYVANSVNFGGLGDYASFHLDGQLRGGKVAVPEIGLELSEVEGEVQLVDGVLRGDKLSARLGKTAGHSGTLAIGLAENDDLFQLELMLDADLAEGKTILKRVVDNPNYTRELDRITMLEGNSIGKLTLGDSFSNLSVAVEDSDLNLKFSHEGLPYPVSIKSGRAGMVKDRVTLDELNGTLGGSVFSGLSGMLDWQKLLSLDVHVKESQLVLDELFSWLKKMEGLKSQLTAVTSVTGKVGLNDAHFKGAIDQSNTWKYGATGDIADVILVTPAFPDKITIPQSIFTLDDQSLTLQKTNVLALDGKLQLQGTLRDWSAVNLGLDGTLGPESVAWLQSMLSVPEKYAVRTPISLSDARLVWTKNDASGFVGNVSFGTGPLLTIAVNDGKKGLNVEQLKIQGIGTDLAELKFVRNQNGIDAGFKGTLGQKTLDAIFVHPVAGKGLLDGDIGVKIPAAKNSMPTAQGRLKGSELLLPLTGDDVLGIGKITLEAEGSKLQTEIDDLLWKEYLFKRVTGTVDVQRDKISANVERTELCGIPVTGRGSYGDDNLELVVEVNGKNLNVTTTYACLTRGKVKMTGTMATKGRITTSGTVKKLIRNLKGPLEITFANGVIQEGRMAAAILEVLNVTEVVRGRLPKLSTSGLSCHTIKIVGKFGEGKLHLDEIHMDGETLDLAGSGFIDLEQSTLHVELLAAPFKTVDSVIKYIPGVNYLMGGSLVAIPLSITGSLENPKVVVMSASSVSKSLLNLGARSLNLPFKLLESILPGRK